MMKLNNKFLLISLILLMCSVCIASAQENTSVSKSGNVSSIDVVCGMTVDPKTAEYTATYEGKSYYFCSQMCKDEFEKDPASFAAKANVVIDPVCKMKIDPVTAAANLTLNGTTYYFCATDCKDKFEKNPQIYLNQSELNQVKDPVCGMSVDPATSVSSEYKGTTYYFCCSKCKAKFDANQSLYLDSSVTTDVVCGMTVDPKTAEFSSSYNGKTYYFCSQMCKDEFEKDPSSFLMKDHHKMT